MLADTVRRTTSFTPSIGNYDDTASQQILIASAKNASAYLPSGTQISEMQYAIIKRNGNILIVSHDEMGVELGAQKVTEAILSSNGGRLALDSLCTSSPVTYTYGQNLNLEHGAEYRIMTYNIERMELNTKERANDIADTLRFYNADVVGFQEFCTDFKSRLVTNGVFSDMGYTVVEPTPEKMSNSETCATRYSITNNYTPVIYKTAKFNLVASGAKRIITASSGGPQGSYGWPGYTITWAVLEDKITKDVFAVTALHNLTGSTSANKNNKIISPSIALDLVKNTIVKNYNCPVFMVGDYNSHESYADIKSFVNEDNGIYDSRYVAERGYAVGNSHGNGTVSCSGTTNDAIDHIFMTGSARVLRHRYGHSTLAAGTSDHKPVFVDVVIGEVSPVETYTRIYSSYPCMYVNDTLYISEEKAVITEIVTSAESGGIEYEFIELYYDGDESYIDLDKYAILQFGYTHSGQYEYSGFQQIYGSDKTYTNKRAYAKIGESVCSTLGTKLESGYSAVLCFYNETSDMSAEEYLEKFKTHWGLSDNDSIICVPYTNPRTDVGYGFLPDFKYGYTLLLFNIFNATFNTSLNSALSQAYDITTDLTAANKASLINNSDCNTVIIARGRKVNGVSANYYSYSENYSNLIIGKETKDVTYRNRTSNAKWSDTWLDGETSYGTESLSFVETVFSSAPTPCRICEGQFGYETKSSAIELLGTQSTPVVEGLTGVRAVGYINSLYYDKISLEIVWATEATDTTKAENTPNLSNAVCSETITLDSTVVYTSIKGTLDDGTEVVYDLEYFKKDSGYIFAISVDGVPADLTVITVKCTAYRGSSSISTGIYEISDYVE